jgi:hypothetical protein
MTAGTEITDAEIAAQLDSAEVSTLSVARRLGVPHRRVAQVRERIKLPVYRRGRRVEEPTWEQALAARIVAEDDGHARWTGATHKRGTPVLNWGGSTWTAYRAVFARHYGREPVGNITPAPGCDRFRCVAGAHLEDRVIREQRRADQGGGA